MSPAVSSIHVPRWRPPLEGLALVEVLSKLRAWEPFDGGALLDDMAVVLDDFLPAEECVDEIAQRLRGHLMRLVDIAIAAEAVKDAYAAWLIEQARTVRSEDVPGDYWRAVRHLRRMGWTVNELLERLVATRCLKAAA